ncbi:MAG: recombinase family protein [Arenicellales bacterium]|jgi:DNA invertase Pin-like site-specific DNA recombinase|nr:recombinase family protein [Arenicellales bacterium]MDP7489537.1 recombinase family protein [Arenicellales bacterium]MDP7568966.1 recombinase family protein [Arenicellales bacterium]|tara:strand:+ start:1383 stop:2006 length:624 start_codon:yes stop_codon:yes gene_type:complete
MNSITQFQSSQYSKRVVIYARVSTEKQTLENQLSELREVASRNNWQIVDEYLEKVSGAKSRSERKEFDRLMKDSIRGRFDLIMAWDVSRLGRSLKNLVEFIEDIHEKNIDLYLHVNGIDTSTSSGRAMFAMIGVFSQFEREIIKERINSGLARAKAEGKKLGRPTNFNSGMAQSVRLLREQGMPIKQIAKNLEIGVGTVYKALDKAA